jgi:tRNA (mo5U34)-methyltransferase
MPEENPFQYVRLLGSWMESRGGWWHSFELPDGTIVEGANDLIGLRSRLARFPIPEDLTGKRVLDIGAWDGWFSFEMEKRGAEVLAIDNWDNPRFHQMRQMMGSSVEYRIMDVYELTPERIGRFDLVLFLGVLYHLKHPILALERVAALSTDMAAVESFVLREEHRPGEDVLKRPIMEFYEVDELGGQTDNWVGPSVPTLMAFCRTAGFARVELAAITEFSGCVMCYRTWGDEVDPDGAAPRLVAAHRNPGQGINFSTDRDDYVSVFFEWDPPRRRDRKAELGLDDVQPEVGGYGTRPLYVGRPEAGGIQANFKLPPGLEPGWQPTRVRVRNGPASNPVEVAVDVAPATDRLSIQAAAGEPGGTPNHVAAGTGRSLSLSVEGLPENADLVNVFVVLGPGRLTVRSVEPTGRGATGPRTVVAEVPDGLEAGSYDVRVAVGSTQSEPVQVAVAA